MTLPDIESQLPESPADKIALHARLLTPDDPGFADWLVAREQLMEAKGWQASGDEFDSYDTNPETRQIVMYDEANVLAFGMRLTPIESYDQTLSWDMVRDSTIHEQARKSGLIEQGRKVWDLTRLAPGPDASYRLRHAAILQLLGEGLRQSLADGDTDPLWVFALDEAMAKWLRREGVSFTTLGIDRVGSDENESTLASIEAAQFIARAEQSPAGSRVNSFAKRTMGSDL